MNEITPNVGTTIEAALALAGQSVLRLGGRFACETDYLAACGRTFPADVPRDELVAFNRRTLREDMDEDAEMRRYVAIAGFFRRARNAY